MLVRDSDDDSTRSVRTHLKKLDAKLDAQKLDGQKLDAITGQLAELARKVDRLTERP